jgi:uncharacterized protein YjbI with pentapeptide repeats
MGTNISQAHQPENIMYERISLDQFLNQRDMPIFQKYHLPKSNLYNLKQFLIDNQYVHYDESSGLYVIDYALFDPSWNMSYLYAKHLDFRNCSLAGCDLVYGDYSYSAFSPGKLAHDEFLLGTNFSFSTCHSTNFTSVIGGNNQLTQINLSNCDLEDAVFNGIILNNATFIKSHFEHTQFLDCELRESIVFDYSRFISSNFKDCAIYSSSFVQTYLEDTTFIGCCIKGSDGMEIDFSQSTVDNIHLTQCSSDDCPEISHLDLSGTHIKNSQLSDLRLANLKINDQFIIENSALVDSIIRVGEDQCVNSCQLQRYFDKHNIRYNNIQFAPSGSICWDDSYGDETDSCTNTGYDSRSLITGAIGFGSALLLIFLVIAAVKFHRAYIRPCLDRRELNRQIQWKTWPLTKALSDSDIDALHQIKELLGPNINLPRELYQLILSKRPGQTDKKYRNTMLDFGDPLPSYREPIDNSAALGIRFFDTKDRKHYRRQQVDNTLTLFFSQRFKARENPIQPSNEATPLINVTSI